MGLQPVLRIARLIDSDWGTLGRLIMTQGQKELRLFALEEEDQQNRRNVSRIPEGTYRIRRVYSPRFGETFEVLDVPGRSHVLFHRGNTEEDTEGCILMGGTVGAILVEDEDTGAKVPKVAVLSSKAAFKQFMRFMEGHDEATLVIRSI